jgi:hypothetical protein
MGYFSQGNGTWRDRAGAAVPVALAVLLRGAEATGGATAALARSTASST